MKCTRTRKEEKEREREKGKRKKETINFIEIIKKGVQINTFLYVKL